MNRLALLALTLAAAMTSAPAAIAQSGTEVAPTYNTADLLAGKPLAGQQWRVGPTARNDGFLNVFSVTVGGETYSVVGNALMRQRLRELAALDEMEKIKRTSIFKDAVVSGVKAPFETAGRLIVSPIRTTAAIASGVGTFFRSVGHALFAGGSDQEDGVLKTALGFGAAKRELAFGLGIDPYTDFPPVRERLNEIAWAATGGSFSVGMGFSAIGGTAGGVLRGAGTAGGMSKLVAENTPAELNRLNERKLRAMRIDAGVARLFLAHPKLTPTEKTLMVEALARIGASNRQAFIERAVLSQSEQGAFVIRRWMEIYREYHRRVAPIARFVNFNGNVFGQREDGVLVVVLPVDHLAWTGAFAGAHATNMQDIPNIPGITGGEIWVDGTLSPIARAEFESENWVVQENAGARFGLN